MISHLNEYKDINSVFRKWKRINRRRIWFYRCSVSTNHIEM